MTRLNNDLISRKALIESMMEDGIWYHGKHVYEAITNAPTIEADSGEADAEVYSTAVYPNSNGMYEHTFLFNDRLAQQTELYLYNPNKYQKREWVELTDEQIQEIRKQANYNQFMTAGEYAEKVQILTQAKLKEVNHG